MLRYGVLLPICAIIAGFSVAGFLVRQAGYVGPMESQQIAQAAADTLRAVPDPMVGAPLDALQSAAAKLHATANATAKGVIAVGANIPSTAAFGADDPTRLRVVAAQVAQRLDAVPSPIPDGAYPTDVGAIQIAGLSLTNWFNSLTGTQPQPPIQAANVEVAAVTPPTAPAPAVVAAMSTPKAVAAPEPEPATPALSAPVAGTPTSAAPDVAQNEPAPDATVVAQATAPSTEPAPAGGDKDKAGSVADQLNQRFNDLMKSLTGSEPQPGDTAKAPDEPTPGAAPADVAGTPAAPASGEPPVSVAEAASDLVLSGVSFVPGTDESGVITLSGRGLAGRKLQLFLDDKQVGASEVAQNGHWLLDVTHPLPLGDHQARADLLADDGKVTHSAIFMFARQAATVAGGESTIVPLAKMATAPAEPPKTDVAAATTATPDVIKIVPPDQMDKTAPAAPVVAEAPAAAVAKPAVVAPRRVAQLRSTPVRRLVARAIAKRPHSVVVTLHLGASIVHVRVPDGLVRSSVGHVSQPRRARHAQPRHGQARKATVHARKVAARRCHRPAARPAPHAWSDRDDDDRW